MHICYNVHRSDWDWYVWLISFKSRPEYEFVVCNNFNLNIHFTLEYCAVPKVPHGKIGKYEYYDRRLPVYTEVISFYTDKTH